MDDVHKNGNQSQTLNLSPVRAGKGRTESASIVGASEYVTAAISEQASISQAAFVTANIELSKCHWSECVKIDCNSRDEEIAEDNLRVFESLQTHPGWGHFFRSFGYDTAIASSSGEMVVGEKFAEGGQAELFHAHITWRNSKYNEYCQNQGLQWVLKVFKKGIRLRELQSQWPQGYLKWWADDFERSRIGYPRGIRWHCDVKYATLMSDGRFAFLMRKETGDLRTHIDQKMLKCGKDVAPFSEGEAGDMLYSIARGVHWLHKHNVVHRDIKASNVLGTGTMCTIADYECSVGVVGTGFWRAPEILQACKDRTVNERPGLFSKASDVYSLGMTCYEVLTGKYPFRDEGATFSDVIKGKQPHMPGFVDVELKDLLRRCWRVDPASRPTVDEILTFLEARSKSPHTRRMKFERGKVREGWSALLGCMDPSHSLSLLECARNGSYVCKMCLAWGEGEVYHCSSCGDFELHPECARVPENFVSFLHPHELQLFGPFNPPNNSICDGCREYLGDSEWVYQCRRGGCDFDLHARCGKYASTIIHAGHKEHELVLIFNLGENGGDASELRCDGCEIRVRSKELVYHCKECNFSIHPSCALGKLVGS